GPGGARLPRAARRRARRSATDPDRERLLHRPAGGVAAHAHGERVLAAAQVVLEHAALRERGLGPAVRHDVVEADLVAACPAEQAAVALDADGRLDPLARRQVVELVVDVERVLARRAEHRPEHLAAAIASASRRASTGVIGIWARIPVSHAAAALAAGSASRRTSASTYSSDGSRCASGLYLVVPSSESGRSLSSSAPPASGAGTPSGTSSGGCAKRWNAARHGVCA